ncbi:MAG: HYR domain-containing protein, partial [Verrucomicrobiaceae bacterium]
LRPDGTVVGWGLNFEGQCNAPAGLVASHISAGAFHSVAASRDGTLAAWGNNQYGQLGDQTTVRSDVPVIVNSAGALAGKTVMGVAAGTLCSLALDSDGKIYAWGSNGTLQLGLGSFPSTLPYSSTPRAVGLGSLSGKTVTSVVAGAYHCLALTSDGKIHSWGTSTDGQMGTVGASAVPVQMTANGALAGKNVVRIAAGHYHSMAITTDGQTLSWGKNNQGQLGDNTINNRTSPVAVTTATGLLGGTTTISVTGGQDNSVAMTGVGVAPAVTDSPDDQTVPASSSVSFSATATGNPAPSVRWQSSASGPGGTFLNINTTSNPSAATNTLQLTNVSAAVNGYAYRAVFTNADAVVYSTPAVLTVIPAPQMVVPAAITTDATGKNGAVVTFNVTATDSTDGTLVPTCTPPSGAVFPIGTTTVNCTVTNSLGSTSNASFTVTVRRSYASFADLHQLTDSSPGSDP